MWVVWVHAVSSSTIPTCYVSSARPFYPLLTRTHLLAVLHVTRITVDIKLHGTESIVRSELSDDGTLLPPGQLAPRSHSVEVAVGRDLLDLRKLPLAVAEWADRARLQPA